MKPEVTVIIPFAYSIKWLQILISSLKVNFDRRIEIVVMDNTPEEDCKKWGIEFFPSGHSFIRTPHPMDWHAGCIDYYLPFIKTPYFMMMESDCQVCDPSWLDNYLNAMKDKYVAMAGWFWKGDDRMYIGPGATIYNTEIVMKIRDEVLADKRKTFCYGNFMRHRHTLEPRLAEMIDKGQWGPFSETRGYHNIVVRDDKWWQEPCAWLYYRLDHDYECVALAGTYTETPHDGVYIASGTYYGPGVGGKIYLVHHWGGTVSHNWEKQKVVATWERIALPWWINREDRIWKEVVPEWLRKRTLEEGLVRTGIREFDFIMNHPNVKQ